MYTRCRHSGSPKGGGSIVKKHGDKKKVRTPAIAREPVNPENIDPFGTETDAAAEDKIAEEATITDGMEDQGSSGSFDVPEEGSDAEGPEEESRTVLSDLEKIDPDLLIGDNSIDIDDDDEVVRKAAKATSDTTKFTPNDIEPIVLDMSDNKKDYPEDTEVPVKKGLRKSRGFVFLICAIIVVTIAVAASIFYEAGYRDKLNSPLTINGSDVSSAEFSFMYHYLLIDNGVDIFAADTPAMLEAPADDPAYATNREYFLDLTAQEMRTTQILYDDARAHGYSIEEDHYVLANAYIDWLSGKADEIGVSLDTYIKGVFGNQVNQQTVVNTLAKKYFTEDYASGAKLEELSASDEQAEAAYQADRTSYDVVNYKILRITYEQRDQAFIDTANLHARQIIEEMGHDPSTFEQIASQYFSGEAQSVLAEPDSTLVSDVRYADFTHSDFRDWLFDPERVPGDSNIYTDDDGFPIILVFVSRDRQRVPLRDVRFAYIPIQMEEGAPGLPITEAQMLAQEIYENANSERDMMEIENIYNDQILSGALSVTHSNDTYPGKYDGILGSWIFSDARVAGDKVFLETESGYYIVYLISISENEEWYDRVNSFIRMNNYQAFINEMMTEYTYSFNNTGLSEIQDLP